MKKIYAIALMAFMGMTAANAQNGALKLDKNYIIYTEHDGVTSMSDVLLGAFLDEEYNTFPVSGGKLSEVKHHLTKDYYDEETGVTIKAGDYNFISTATELKFKDSYLVQGLKNIKKVIAYIGGIGSNTTYVRMTQKEEDGENYVHYEGEPETNRAWSYYCAPDLKTGPNDDGNKRDDMDLTYSSPIKLTIDLTNNTEGTDEDINGHKLYVNANKSSFFQGTSGTWYCDYEEAITGQPVTEKNMFMQFYEQAKDADNKIIKGDKLIPWSPENRYSVAFKKGAFIMALAFICAEENPETVSINIKDGGSANWTTGIDNVISDGNATDNTVEAVYTVGGARVNALGKGVNIVKYSDGRVVKIIR